MSHDVFISYASEDKTIADAVCATLERTGVRCWIAPRDVLPGSEWSEAIIDAIGTTRIVLLVFSSHANASTDVRREVRSAFERAKVVVPFRVEDVVPSRSLDYYLGPVHWLDAMTPPIEAHLTALAESIKRVLAASLKGDSVVNVTALSQAAEDIAPQRQPAQGPATEPRRATDAAGVPSNANSGSNQSNSPSRSRLSASWRGAVRLLRFKYNWALVALILVIFAVVANVIRTSLSRPESLVPSAQPTNRTEKGPSPTTSTAIPGTTATTSQPTAPSHQSGASPVSRPTEPLIQSSSTPTSVDPEMVRLAADCRANRNVESCKRGYSIEVERCESGSAQSCMALGFIIESGMGWSPGAKYNDFFNDWEGPSNENTLRLSMKYYERACDLGQPRGCAYLGRIYHGRSAVKDLERARQWYQRGCTAGDPEACRYLQELRDTSKTR